MASDYAEFEAEAPADYSEFMTDEAPVSQDVGPKPDYAAAKRGLDKMQSGVGASALEPGELQAIQQMLASKGIVPRAKMYMPDAVSELGANAALGGLPAYFNPAAKERLAEARRQYPGLGTASEALGAAVTGLSPGGLVTGAIQGGVQGYTSSDAPDILGKAKDALYGAGANVVAGHYGGKIANGVLGAAKYGGQGMQKLAKLIGLKEPVPPSAAESAAQRAAGFADVADDVAAANPMRSARERMMTRGDNDYAAEFGPEVNRQGAGNVRPDDWQSPPNEKFDQMALERLIQQQRRAEMDKINAEIATRTQQRPLPDTKPLARREPNTAVMSTDDVLGLKGRAMRDNIDKVQDIMPYDSGAPIESIGAAPRKPGNAIDVLSSMDEAALGKLAGKPAAAPTPIDPRRQKIIDAQLANPEALAAFGVDPRQGERGFMDLGLGIAAADAAKWAAKNAAKAAAPGVDRVGKSIESMAKRAASDPGMLMQLMREGGALGGAARAMLQALQSGDRTTLKAQAALLEFSPEFRERVSQGTAGQDPAMSAASGF